MTDSAVASPPKKKSVALSGVVAGNTALCTVGRTGNDLHYRGYDILEVAEACEFEEIAHLLVHEHLPTPAELAAYRAKLISLRGLPDRIRKVLEALPASSHPMDVMRTGVSALGCVELDQAHPRFALAHRDESGPIFPALAVEQVERVAHHAVAMLDACIQQGFNDDVRDQSAHRIRVLL